MVGANFNYQFLDWAHDEIAPEDFDHAGTLSATVFTPNITIGITDWWNVTFSQVIGRRVMTWGVDRITPHHRDEGSDSDFDNNAVGGILGDSRIMLRFLALNAGKGPGLRLFSGVGIGIPSKNQLTKSPFLKNEDGIYDEHRHFSMSEGIYKAIFETQFFVKRIKNPVFAGGTFSIEQPLGESEYGYKGSRLVDFSLTAFSKKIKLINGSIGGNVMIRNTSEAYWNGIAAPNSKSTLIIPGIGTLWSLGFATLSVNLQYPIFIDGAFAGGDGDANENIDTWQISIGMRRILDYYIPWLYW
jgi:hypothetical protein